MRCLSILLNPTEIMVHYVPQIYKNIIGEIVLNVKKYKKKINVVEVELHVK